MFYPSTLAPHWRGMPAFTIRGPFPPATAQEDAPNRRPTKKKQ